MSVAESVRQRLLNLSRERNVSFDLILTRYSLERLLYRISKSKWKNEFLLKSAMLFYIWDESTYRPTRDLDLMANLKPDINHMKDVFKSICRVDVENDGLEFIEESTSCEEIREGNQYNGIRVRLLSSLTSAKIRIQIDVGLGDIVTPKPVKSEFPTLLDFPAPILLTYTKYSVISEKFQIMVMLGIANSRMKDFYDIWIMSERFDFSGLILSDAIKNTFKRRDTSIPDDIPFTLTDDFANDNSKTIQWNAFLKKNKIEVNLDFNDVVKSIRKFLMPVLNAISEKKKFNKLWKPSDKWIKK